MSNKNQFGRSIQESKRGVVGGLAEEVDVSLWKEGEERATGEYAKARSVVHDNDNNTEVMNQSEMFRYKNDQPMNPGPCRHRTLQCLELFCGEYFLLEMLLIPENDSICFH